LAVRWSNLGDRGGCKHASQPRVAQRAKEGMADPNAKTVLFLADMAASDDRGAEDKPVIAFANR